ncbi:DUF3142 domain-containing protein [Pontiellaceae bacterium B1224]|nr:DUF3142 domain-containing protein [Pontiellaceae bacterium B1224]
MKQLVLLLSLIFLPSLCVAQNAFYVWQQLWSSNVLEAVCAEPATTLYPVATVVPASGTSTLVQIPWNEVAATDHRFVPVIRIPLQAFNRNDLEPELVRLAHALKPFDEIQLDLDCPESRMNEYADLISNLRKQIPQPVLSITVLPCHVGNRSFQRLAETVDSYVLQVHGLAVPETFDDPAELMNRKTADRAIRQAEAWGRPYSIALPCYAYELNFDPTSEKFMYLTAEGPSRRRPTLKKRIAADPADLIDLVSTFQTLEHAEQIIWFRLPVKGDRLCLPRPTLCNIEAGELPMSGIECVATAISPTTLELALYNTNVIHATRAELTFTWDKPSGAFDLYQNIDRKQIVPGQLPTTLSVDLPAPGQSVKLGWFSSTNSPKTTVNLK